MKGALREKILPKFYAVRNRRIAAIRLVRWAKKTLSSRQDSLQSGEKQKYDMMSKNSSILHSSFYNDSERQFRCNKFVKEKTEWEKNELRAAAKESYREMVKYGEEHDILIVEKCYILLDVRKAERVLLFAALKQIINTERWVSMHIYVQRRVFAYDDIIGFALHFYLLAKLYHDTLAYILRRRKMH